mmetsp:Transcript_41072/g.98995  ORF Transcript_41072/g.98995 Transcript_41072/m.98995 type:complete len:673 (-) Transcript_41072:28-2046(-)|eukprot:CAMPEP_0113627622 /NCGR_PEP_ID=MMETSP0017_2-20120614/14308_1 /TAXON_ID=2856 /ORGANISM="Cylindrotheca closterium" /LENGTH=672 /DNA_ID=CAMNT_0000537889 /DNA_START=253 /DNA_END=2271 /DNA_ORIENTATION=+ /assembly_acc=CAM_ASM_000147
MSRRRGEFEHRTSIFEGAFRAWSHLGGLDPEDLESKSQDSLDPLSNPIQNDDRMTGKLKEAASSDPSRRVYPYEPLPRSGLAHPFVQAILSPWLGPDADNDAIQLGLTTLRTWWQHRRKGESGSAVAALGTEKMKGVVEGYTRHFFQLGHCLILNDKEQPPRSLSARMKELDKMRSKGGRKKKDDGTAAMPTISKGGALAASIHADLTNKNLSPLEQLHRAQQRKLAVEGTIQACPPQASSSSAVPIIEIKNKCVASAVNLPAVVDAVNHAANQLAHSGAARAASTPNAVPSTVLSGPPQQNGQYGDPDTVPIIFISENSDIMVAMSVDGITCAHCVKIVETVLKGCNGNKSPIDGLLDAAADRVLCSVLLKIDTVANAKRIAFEAARNLAMVGYTAKAKEMSSSIEQNGKKTDVPPDKLYKAFAAVALSDRKDVFDWSAPCTCPDNGVLRNDCPRHSQMSTNIFEAFDNRGRLVTQFLSGAKLSSPSPPPAAAPAVQFPERQQQPIVSFDTFAMQNNMGGNNQGTGAVNGRNNNMNQNAGMDMFQGNMNEGGGMMHQRAQRNPSIISFGGRNMSFASERSYGRAMSGLSALSIDWENMEDFDVNVDHSAHINNNLPSNNDPLGGNDMMMGPPIGGGGGRVGRRSSLRQSFMIGAGGAASSSNANNAAEGGI